MDPFFYFPEPTVHLDEVRFRELINLNEIKTLEEGDDVVLDR
jgi:hypothetical protein